MIGVLAELVRLPAVVTVPGDAWATGARDPSASVLLYWAGMALNDFADRDLDALERPERPIPSGRLSAGAALAVAVGLTAGGVGVAHAHRRGPAGLAVASAVWTYDLWAKRDPVLGPVVMAATRTLDVLQHCAVRDTHAAMAAGAIGVATFGVTTISRGEVTGGTHCAASVFAASVALAASAAVTRVSVPMPRSRRVGGIAAVAAFSVVAGRAALDVLRSNDPGTVRRSTRSGLMSLPLLQAAFSAHDSVWRTGTLVLAPLAARTLARGMAVT